MSSEQESIWLNDQFSDGLSRYLESWAYRLRGGRVDPVAVREALTMTVARHEALRSRLGLLGATPWQMVMPPVQVPLDVRRVRHPDVQRAMVAAATRPVALDRPPLLRATLLELAKDDAVLVVAIHHAVIDGASLSLLSTEFSAHYRAARDGTASRLPPLALQFGPYAEERRRSSPEALSKSLRYWRETLAGAPQESSFPTDRPRPTILGARGDRVEFAVGSGLGSEIRLLARQARTTPFTVMATALTALISRLSGCHDVVLGTPVSRRDDESLEPMIACLADVMPLRCQVGIATSFAGLMTQLKEQLWGAIEHRDVSYSHLVRELQVERSPARFALFQVVVGMDEAPAPALDLPGVTAERLYIHSGTAKYDVFLHLVPRRRGFAGFLEFNTDLFDRSTAERLAERLHTLLKAAVAHPETPLRDLDILTAAERRLLDKTWAQGAEAPTEPPLAHTAFAAQARRTPDASAVIDGPHALSYAQLAKISDDIAAHLVARGMTGRPVGVCLRRCADMAAAVLGVLKAGCGCLPIDPAYPPDRIAYMAADSGIEVALVHEDLTGPLPDSVTAITVAEMAAAPRRVLPAVAPGDLSYLIYTSGSTGRPKGVAMPHRSLANLLAWQQSRSLAGPGSRTLQFAALSFDVAFQEMFSTWAGGGTLVMADDKARRDPGRLLDLIESQRVERLFLPFVALQQLAEYACASNRSAATLREVVTAGEQLLATPALREFFRHRAPGAVLENQYGPSETHVVTAERLGDNPDAWSDLPSIGRPVDGARVVLLDRQQQLSPVGTMGEICVGGPALASGYWGRPELTAQKFIADPFRPGALLYRTGDLARHLPDGRIQFLGRLDEQVKIRGYRVETGEVASAVQTVPGVAHAAVVARKAASGGLHLVAYYISGAGFDLPPDLLRRTVARQLPEYMLPTVWVPLETFPRTASGKVDLGALPDPVRLAEPEGSFVAPTTPLEKRIAGIWQELLVCARVSVHDDFYALGGNSLLATRLLLTIRAELGIEVPFHLLLTAPTVAALAELLERNGTAGLESAEKGLDLTAEINLPADIAAADDVVQVAVSPTHVLLTGATGFLGAATLRSLLDRTRAVVHCLVRGTNRDQAAARLRRALERYKIWDERASRRVVIVLGDLAQPRLGLPEAAFDDLAHRMDAVYHVGAAVHLASSYAQLKPTTVGGTIEILRLAARHRSVPVHHVSTVGVFAGHSDKRIGPEHPIGPAAALTHGYTQSKWVAEGLIEAARARSLPATIYRPTRIAGHSGTGAYQSGDYLWLVLKGCIQAQAAPAGTNAAFDLVPVDYVSDAIVVLSQQRSEVGRTFHLAAGELIRLDTMLDWLRARGYSLLSTDIRRWLEIIGSDGENAAFPLLGTLAEEMAGAGSEGGLVFDPSAADALLTDCGVHRPVVDEASFNAYVEFFNHIGWLPSAGTV
ncbi:amino acid adenylation domain-containing protein [Micromonospora sp. NPDC000089]